MSQAGYTPIQLYFSTTAAAVPVNTNLANGELAINITDGKLYYKDNTGTVKLLAGATAGPAGGSNTQVQYNSSGVLAGSANMTFDGTSMTLGGNPTLSAGTANGVTYLNGSKVLTSGAELTTNGSTTLTVPAEVSRTSETSYIRLAGGTAGNGANVIVFGGSHASAAGRLSLSAVGTGDIISNTISGTHIYQINSAEQMRLTSTGLGIGTSSPAYKLDVQSSAISGIAANFQATAANTYATIRLTGNSRGGEVDFYNGSTAQAAIVAGSGNLYFYTNGNSTLQATLDSAGNLGLGVTPSASWVASSAALQQSIGAIYYNGSLGAYDISYNSIRTASDTYVYAQSSVLASRLQQRDGTFRFFTAASGTAGNAISFTQAMTLDASGNLMLGVTSAIGQLTLSGAYGTTQTSGFVIRSTGSTTGLLAPIAFYLQSSSWGTVHQATITAQQVSGTDGGANLVFRTSSTGQFAPTEYFRIASTGAFGLSGANYGTSGQVLTSGGSGAAPTWTTVSGGGSPGGSTTQVQYNNAGAFAGSANFTFDGTTVTHANDTYATSVRIGRGASAVGSNTVVGSNGALGAITTGSGNSIFGAFAGAAITTGTTNSGFGYGALNAVTTGSANTTFGYSSLQKTTGSDNTAVGSFSQFENLTGVNNTSIGSNALRANTAGSYNSALGDRALYLNTANNNTGAGYTAGYSNTTGTQNTFVGMQAGYGNTTGNAVTAVGYGALQSSTAGSNTAFGHSALGSNTSGTKNVAVGGPLWATANAALQANTTGTDNVAMGVSAMGLNTTGSENTAIGNFALRSNTISNGNVAIGHQAMYYSNRTSDSDNYSIAIGYQALFNVTTGANNTVVGREAGISGTSFGAVCAFGRNALRSSTANQNSAFGYASGSGVTSGTYNSYFGSENAQSTSTGSYNCGYGYGSLYGVTTGSNNACYGTYAGYALTTGSLNVFLGQDAGRTGSPGGNFTTESNRVVIGNGSVTNAYIQVAWTVTSDARDKTDIVDAKYGLDFIKGLRPVEFKWDKRSNYFKGITDGTHKEAKTQLGFLAQEVIALEKQHGGVAKDLLIADDEKEEEIVSITETKFIPVLVKALQELNAKFDQLKAEHDAYVASHP